MSLAARRILLFVAGNDLNEPENAAWIGDEMRGLKDWWAMRGVELIYVDVIPSNYWHL